MTKGVSTVWKSGLTELLLYFPFQMRRMGEREVGVLVLCDVSPRINIVNHTYLP